MTHTHRYIRWKYFLAVCAKWCDRCKNRIKPNLLKQLNWAIDGRYRAIKILVIPN